MHACLHRRLFRTYPGISSPPIRTGHKLGGGMDGMEQNGTPRMEQAHAWHGVTRPVQPAGCCARNTRLITRAACALRRGLRSRTRWLAGSPVIIWHRSVDLPPGIRRAFRGAAAEPAEPSCFPQFTSLSPQGLHQVTQFQAHPCPSLVSASVPLRKAWVMGRNPEPRSRRAGPGRPSQNLLRSGEVEALAKHAT